jgi:methylglutaconyl-CoA hydratase
MCLTAARPPVRPAAARETTEERGMAELVHYGVDRGVATITLDSPRNRNALSGQLVEELLERLVRAEADPGVRAVVLTGTGRVFCSGADLAEQLGGDGAGAADPARAPRALVGVLQGVLGCAKPVVGRINGHARAGGIGLVAACDIAIAPAGATFALTEVRVGVVPAIVSVVILPRITPRAGMEYFLTGETFDATRAAEIGLVNRAVPDDALDAEVERYLDLLRLGAPGALADCKALVRAVPRMDADDAFEAMTRLSIDRFGSDEGAEGMRAFLDRRAPSWAPGASG